MQAFYEIPGLNVYTQLVVTIISISVHLFNTRNTDRKESVIEIMSIYVIGLAGWFGIMSGLFGHIIHADQVAASIGWPVNSGFQMELGFASISIGLVGFLSFWNKGYRLPFIIMKTIFMWGAGYTHILHAVQHNNFSPGNTGIIVYWDFLFPAFMIVLYMLYRRQQEA
ncbi:MAG TPA: hypothetical protein DCX53_09590 [Anaerolineae bacterium]|nr:hypothetical protein [Anaerolineae bacterium]